MKKETFKEVVDYLFDHKYFYRKFDSDELIFDYPDYLNLPTYLIKKLSPEFVDAVQNCLLELTWHGSTRKHFSRAVKEELKRLGEGLED